MLLLPALDDARSGFADDKPRGIGAGVTRQCEVVARREVVDDVVEEGFAGPFQGEGEGFVNLEEVFDLVAVEALAFHVWERFAGWAGAEGREEVFCEDDADKDAMWIGSQGGFDAGEGVVGRDDESLEEFELGLAGLCWTADEVVGGGEATENAVEKDADKVGSAVIGADTKDLDRWGCVVEFFVRVDLQFERSEIAQLWELVGFYQSCERLVKPHRSVAWSPGAPETIAQVVQFWDEGDPKLRFLVRNGHDESGKPLAQVPISP